ncbi:hypothetical protein FB451DRAFT_1150613 [Mycena latifolia]|nr:hypothetical protein FB451DRAFT_1150613 [Mycena latifolia]
MSTRRSRRLTACPSKKKTPHHSEEEAGFPSSGTPTPGPMLSVNPDFNDGPAGEAEADTSMPDADVQSISSDPITPPPAPAKKTRKHSPEPSISLDSDELTAPAKKPKKKKKVAHLSPAPEDRPLVLMILRAEGVGQQREILSHATTFDDALAIIHSTIGCKDIPIKPVLTYKLSNAAAKVLPINLGSAKDWAGCLQEVAAAEGKKIISVEIQVAVQYIVSLRAKLGIKLARQPKGRGKQAKMQILDLEHAESGDDDFDDSVGIMDKEKKFLEQLQAQHGHCQLCRPSKSCKIDVSGNHCPLSNGQLRGWALALATGTHNVTLKTPPNNQLFGMFFKNSLKATPSASTSTVAPPPFALPPYMAMNPMNLYAFMPWAMPGMPAASPFNGNLSTPVTPTPIPPTSHASGSKLTPAFPSSDPPDMGAVNPYPGMTEFLEQLDGYEPQRRLFNCISKFEELDFYHIDEIAALETPQELARVAEITLGNANYIMKQVKGQIKCVDRERKASGASGASTT